MLGRTNMDEAHGESRRVEVQITFEDFEEAVQAVQTVNARRMRERAEKKARSPALLAWVGIVALATAGVLVFIARLSIDRYEMFRPPLYWPMMFVIPLLVAAVTLGIFVAVQHRRSQVRGKRGRGLAVGVVSWAAVLVLLPAMILLERTTARPGAPARPPADWLGTIAPHAVWSLTFIGLLYLALRATGGQVRQAWDAQAVLRRPRTITITPDDLTVNEIVAERRYAWTALVRFIETKNLFLLCPSEMTFEIVTKRSFASPEDVDAARTIFSNEIRDPDTIPSAFPVKMPPAEPTVRE